MYRALCKRKAIKTGRAQFIVPLQKNKKKGVYNTPLQGIIKDV